MKKPLLLSAVCLAWLGAAGLARAQPIPPNNGGYMGVAGSVPWRGAALGFCTLSVTSGAAVALSSCSGGIPANTRVAYVIPETAAVRWRDDGTAPTTTVGYPLSTNVQLIYSANPMSAWQVIAQSATTAVDVAFYQ